MSDETEKRCACGETVWVLGKGWDLNHRGDECCVADFWVQRATFEKSKLEIVKLLVEANWSETRNLENLEIARRRAADLEGEIERARRDAEEWREVATAQARILGRRA